MESLNLELEDDALEFIRDRGSRVYLWSSDGGPMVGGVAFKRLRRGGIEAFREEELVAAQWELRVHLAWFPRRQLVLVNKGAAGGGSLDGDGDRSGDGDGC